MPARSLRPSIHAPVTVLLLAAAAAAPVRADDLGLYVGGGIGAAQQNFDPHVFAAHGTPTAYKIEFGIRPLPILAAEVSYVDFGRAYGGPNYADTNAVGVFALGYLPVPLVDVFAKVGLAESRTNAEGNIFGNPISVHESGANIAYGAGVGTHWGHFAVRVEYERYQISHASDMALGSIGMTWTFL